MIYIHVIGFLSPIITLSLIDYYPKPKPDPNYYSITNPNPDPFYNIKVGPWGLSLIYDLCSVHIHIQ